jgi:hypothetical protein
VARITLRHSGRLTREAWCILEPELETDYHKLSVVDLVRRTVLKAYISYIVTTYAIKLQFQPSKLQHLLMPPKSNSQASVPAAAPTKRQPRKLDRTPTAPASRAGSEGGVLLPSNYDNTPGSLDPTAKTGPAPRRRRPKKLNCNGDGVNAAAPAAKRKDPGINVEVEELKSRVRGIEAQVQELLHRPVPANKSPRRRLRHQKGQESEPVDEMEKLQRDLESARGELANLRTRSTAAEAQDDEEEVEEMPRLQEPSLERPQLPNRAVTLSGSYRIPLPTSVRNDDLLAIQRGITSAQNVARSFLDSRTREERDTVLRSQDGKPFPN